MAVTTIEIEKAKHIISVAKTLREFPLGDPKIANFLSATWLAGRAGLLASALRGHKKLSSKKFNLSCANQGIGIGERPIVIRWLEKSGLVAVERADDGTKTFTNTILAYDNILKATHDCFQSLNPTDEESACIDLAVAVSNRPLRHDEALEILSKNYTEPTIKVALSLARAFRFVQERTGRGLSQPILFLPTIWGKNIDRVAKCLSSLDRTDREILTFFVEKVRNYQGYPYDLLYADAKKNNATKILELCIHVGLLLKTEIVTAEAQKNTFLTTPHFFAEIASEHGGDVCDRVKVFLDSIRNGQHYGRPGTGRIFNPSLLLHKLLDTGEIGPCSAIGTDYVVAEKEGIVKVKRATSSPGQSVMQLVQKDTVQKTYEIVSRTFISAGEIMRAQDLKDERSFLSEEQTRVKLADLPGPMQEAERAIILAIRE
jgi:hypothetical protein